MALRQLVFAFASLQNLFVEHQLPNLIDLNKKEIKPELIADTLDRQKLDEVSLEAVRDFGRSLVRATKQLERPKIEAREDFRLEAAYSVARLETAIKNADLTSVQRILATQPGIFASDHSDKQEGEAKFLELALDAIPTKGEEDKLDADELDRRERILAACLDKIYEIGLHHDFSLSPFYRNLLKKSVLKLRTDLVDQLCQYGKHIRLGERDIDASEKDKYGYRLHLALAILRDPTKKSFNPDNPKSVQAYLDLLRFLLIKKKVPIGEFEAIRDKPEKLLSDEKNFFKSRLRKEDQPKIDSLYAELGA